MQNNRSIMADANSAAAVSVEPNAASNGSPNNGDVHRMATTMFHLTGDHDFISDDQFFVTQFTTLNDSGVTGEAIVGYDVDAHTITVAISAAGLEPNEPHIQHIHGFTDGTDSQTPTLANDTDGDGYVELAEGLASYGGILLNLTTDHSNTSGGDNGHSHDGSLTGFPTAPNGTEWFVETYQLPAGMLPTDPQLDLREIVIHGMSVPDGAGAGTAGEVMERPGINSFCLSQVGSCTRSAAIISSGVSLLKRISHRMPLPMAPHWAWTTLTAIFSASAEARCAAGGFAACRVH